MQYSRTFISRHSTCSLVSYTLTTTYYNHSLPITERYYSLPLQVEVFVQRNVLRPRSHAQLASLEGIPGCVVYFLAPVHTLNTHQRSLFLLSQRHSAEVSGCYGILFFARFA